MPNKGGHLKKRAVEDIFIGQGTHPKFPGHSSLVVGKFSKKHVYIIGTPFEDACGRLSAPLIPAGVL